MNTLESLMSHERPISAAFALMQIAEDEIKAAIHRLLPQQSVAALRVWNSFGALVPGPLSQFSSDLYTHHVRELLDRVVREEGLELGTRAEVVAAVSVMSLASRLDSDVEQLALDLAADMFPALREHGDTYSYSYAGAREETLAELRRKTAVQGRAIRAELREIPPWVLPAPKSSKRRKP